MIFQNAIWQEMGINKAEIVKYSKVFGTEPMMTQLLLERGFKDSEAVKQFLDPTMDQLFDPFLLLDMDLAVSRIHRAISQKEKIWLYGDYDVDGITSISILYKFFEWIDVPVDYYIPDRHDEGYGISLAGIDTIHQAGGQLLISVDCGITAVEEVEYAKQLGLDMVITDHHECQEVIPEAIAVVNPKRGRYPFPMLAGCGVAFKLTQALSGQHFKAFYKEVIDILALGTVADIVPLVSENRVFTRLGLEKMMDSSNAGIRALITEANLKGKEVNAGHIGFVIAPRINASGRIGNPKIAVEMLITKDQSEADRIAKQLSELNLSRQSREREIMDEALAYIEQHINLDIEKVLLVVGKDWHTGIIGIVASKLSERYSRPTVILNVEEGMAKGSARSVDGISIFEILGQYKHLYSKFGGHEQAAGLSLSAENVPLLKQALIEYSRLHLPDYKLQASKHVSGYLKPQMVTHKLLDEIEKLKPFGLKNPKPQFVFQNLQIEDYKLIGKQKNHIKLMVNDGIRMYDALAFNQSEMASYIRKNDSIHLLLYLEKNNFMGVETIQFMIRDYIKEKLPFKAAIERYAHEAVSQFLIQEESIPEDFKFTSTDDFDIMFSAPSSEWILVYSYEGLVKIKDYIMKKNIYNYTLHFNEINQQEVREGYRNIMMMPLGKAFETIPSGYILDEVMNQKYLAAQVPDRNDLAYFYKKVIDVKTVDLVSLSQSINMSIAKCLLCFELLKQMKLMNYYQRGSQFTLELLPKPKQKMDVESITLFKHLMVHWRQFNK